MQNIGYCQGMNYLVATFLLVGMAEDMAFWMLAAVVERILPQTYFSRSLVGAQADQKVGGPHRSVQPWGRAELTMLPLSFHSQVLAILIHRRLPRLFAQIERFHTPMSLVTMAWSMTAYLSVLPFQVRPRQKATPSYPHASATHQVRGNRTRVRFPFASCPPPVLCTSRLPSRPVLLSPSLPSRAPLAFPPVPSVFP